MRLPELTPLQFVAVHLLFAGPKESVQLRQALDRWGGSRTQPAFSKLMSRLVYAEFVAPEYWTEVVRGQVDPALPAQPQPDRFEQVVRITHDPRIAQYRSGPARTSRKSPVSSSGGCR